MRVDVTNCDDCPFFKLLRYGDDSWYECAAPFSKHYESNGGTLPTWCPLLDGDITIGVVGDGDE